MNMPADAPYSARVDRLKLSDHPDRRVTDAVDLDFVRDVELVKLGFTGSASTLSRAKLVVHAGIVQYPDDVGGGF